MAPITDDERRQVAALHAEGHGRNEISRRTGIHTRRVSAIAADLGLDFVRGERTRAATEAKKADAKSRRAALALALLGDAERLRGQLWQPADYVAHGGKEFERADWTMKEPTFADKAKIMQSVGIAVDKAVRLDQYDADPGVDAAKSMLGALAAGLGAAYDQLNQPSADDAG